MMTDMVIDNLIITDAFVKANSVFRQHESAAISISGGADSDVMLDLCHRVARETRTKVTYVWFNTGLEYEATKRHLRYLEERYGIEIVRGRAIKPIPTCCQEYGQPFLSKYVSEQIGSLQSHGFQWEDEPFEVLNDRYPRCKSPLRWWTNDFMGDRDRPTRFDIAHNKWLKEFMLEHHPTFAISNKCCTYAKKNVMKAFLRDNDQGFDLDVVGIRRAEGGFRAVAYKTCFDSNNTKYGIDVYRPLFWFSNDDRAEYERLFGITHSDCYTVYGYKRTGCAGCPFNRDFEEDLRVMQFFEPKLFRAVSNIFTDSYEYTRRYREFYARMQEERA